MPNVTIDPTEYTRHDLKTAPPDGFVMLRPLPYAMKLSRRDKALKMRMIQRQAQKGTPQNQDQVIDLETLGEWSTMFDFTYCIGEHNLTDKANVNLVFNDPKTIAMVFKSLAPKVGSEIERYIDELNADEDEGLASDLVPPLGTSSEEDTSSLLTVSSDTQT